MICLMEPQCVSWQHEMVNAGLVKLVLESFQEEAIVVACEKEHFNCIIAMLDDVDVKRIKFQEINLDFEVIDSCKSYERYEEIIRNCLRECPQITNFILMSSHKGNMNAVRMLADEYRSVKFTIVLHAIMEKLISKAGVRNFISVKRYAISLAAILNQLATFHNVNFVIYNPCLNKNAKKVLRKSTLDKIHFINHPYIYAVDVPYTEHEGIRIGIVGACNQFANSIVEKSICTKDNYYVSMTGGKPYNRPGNVKFVNDGERITREQLDKEVKKQDFILLPYARDKYRISASGVLFDSLNYRKPMIMLDSPLLRYYSEKFDVGYFFEAEDELISFVNKVFSESRLPSDYNGKISNIERSIIVMQRENCEWIKNIVK